MGAVVLLFVAAFMTAQALCLRGWFIFERMKAEVNAKLPEAGRFAAFPVGFEKPWMPHVVWQKHKALYPESALRRKAVISSVLVAALGLVMFAGIVWVGDPRP